MSTDKSEREAFRLAHKHLDLQETPDAWGQPMFFHSHVEAMWSGWQARAAQPSQPATVVPVAWLFQCRKPGTYMEYASVDENDTQHWPMDQWRSVTKTPLYAHPSAPAESGWQWVPVEPTRAMQDAWDGAPFNEDADDEFYGAYRATLKAAPSAAQPGGES